MNFGNALEVLKNGGKVARFGWNGEGIFLKLQRTDEHSKMTGDYIYIDTTGLETDNKKAPKVVVPWVPSASDLLSEDWYVY